MSVAPPAPGAPARGRARSALLFAVGLGLAAGAVWAAARGQGLGALGDAWEAARRAPLAVKAGVVLLPAVNWVITSLIFLVLTRGHGRVGAGEMAALIGAAGLYNYLPLRPGLVGRVAYHRAVNAIPVMASIRVLATTIAVSGVAVVLLLTSAVVATRVGSGAAGLAAIAAPAAVAGAMAWWGWARGAAWWRAGAALALRCVDLWVWTARYALVFAMIGRPIDAAQGAAIAGVGQVVTVVPLAGNGLGLREWAVGWSASAMPAWLVPGPAATTSVGLSADLLNRGAELPAAVVIGVLSSVVVARRLGAGRS